MRSNILVLLLLSVAILTAAPVGRDQAQQIAERFLEYRHVDTVVNSVAEIQNRETLSAYVMKLDDTGFVIVSPDDRLTPVLAYSFSQPFEFAASDPFVRMIETDVALRLQWLDENGRSAADDQWVALLDGQYGSRTFQQWPADGSTSTDGWIQTRWTQTGQLNNMCPLDSNGERSVVGCVATAMSQIVNFHEYIGGATFDESDSYVSGWWDGINIDNDHEVNDFPTFPELTAYLNTLDQHYNDGIDPTSEDLAALSFACGISVQMSYSSTGSGAMTEDVVQAFLSKFNYDSAQWMEYSNSVLDVLADEARNMRPTEMSILLADYSGGHAINCDGYNTDDYYHLNFGWGTSDASCWYSLPEGMPSGYCIITGVAVDIEARVTPVGVSGTVTVSGQSPDGTYIRLEGPWTYEVFITGTNGQFTIPAVYPGIYTATATLDGRLYYQTQTVTIDDTHHTLAFSLDEYAAITGNVQADIDPAGACVTLFGESDGRMIPLQMAEADESGAFSFPDQIPGSYLITANLPGGYWGMAEFDYTADQQSLNLPLSQYRGDQGVSWSDAPVGLFRVPANYSMSCALKLRAEDFAGDNVQIISGVRFKAPAGDEQCDLAAQVWEGSVLIAQTALSGFVAGQWLEAEFDRYIQIREGFDYYIGYSVNSQTGDAAWYDNGSRVSGRGAYIHTSGWVELGLNQHDYNFCIEAITRLQDFAAIEGTIDLSEDNADLTNAVVHAGCFSAHADADGNYTLILPAGEYTLSVSLYGYQNGVSETVTVGNGQVLEDIDITLLYDPSSLSDNEETTAPTAILSNYPNPFNPETTLAFNLAEPAEVTVAVYNIRGERVVTLAQQSMTAGIHSVRWNGCDTNGNGVSSGVYFFTLQSRGRGGIVTATHKVLLLK